MSGAAEQNSYIELTLKHLCNDVESIIMLQWIVKLLQFLPRKDLEPLV